MSIHFMIKLQCGFNNNKWKKMKQQLKKEVDKSRRRRTGRRKKLRYFDDMEAICGHRDNITPTVLLDSSKDEDHSDHSEGESINDTERSEIGNDVMCSFSVIETLDGRSYFFPFFWKFPYLIFN